MTNAEQTVFSDEEKRIILRKSHNNFSATVMIYDSRFRFQPRKQHPLVITSLLNFIMIQ